MIRAIPSNASDNIYCTLLAQSAVHGAMAGYTGFTVGPVNSRHAYIPISVSTSVVYLGLCLKLSVNYSSLPCSWEKFYFDQCSWSVVHSRQGFGWNNHVSTSWLSWPCRNKRDAVWLSWPCGSHMDPSWRSCQCPVEHVELMFYLSPFKSWTGVDGYWLDPIETDRKYYTWWQEKYNWPSSSYW